MKKDEGEVAAQKSRRRQTRREKRLTLWKRLLPHIGRIIWDWGLHHNVPPNIIEDAVQEARMKLFEKIVQKGEDRDEPSYDKQFALNRAKNYFFRKHFISKEREISIGDTDGFFDQCPEVMDDPDGSQEIDEEPGSFARRDRWESSGEEYMGTGKPESPEPHDDERSHVSSADTSVLDKGKRNLVRQHHKNNRKMGALKRGFLDLRDSEAFSSEELQVAEAIAKHDECFRLDDVQLALGYQDSEFEGLLTRIERKARYVGSQAGDWDMYRLRRLLVEKFEQVIKVLFHAPKRFDLYRPLRPKKRERMNGDERGRGPKLAPCSERLERARKDPMWGRSFQVITPK